MKVRALLWIVAAAMAPALTLAADAKLQVAEVRIAPAAAPLPALKYQLLPDFLDQTPGDAAPIYLKALARESFSKEADDAFHKGYQRWLAIPPATLPVEEVKKALAPFENVLRHVAIAARRSTCQWDPPVREESNPYTILLPELKDLRGFGRILAVRIHVAIAEHKYNDALHDLQTGYALARHVAQMPFLVSSLVGSAIVGLMNNELEAFLQAPGAPNLYWAIATLPQPIVDFRPGYELERTAIYLALPQMMAVRPNGAASERAALSQQTIDKMIELAKTLGSDADLQKFRDGPAIAALAAKARLELIAHGHAEKKVQAMTPPQALAVNAFEGYDEFRDELFKWLALPYAEAHSGIKQSEAQLKAATDAQSPRALLAGVLLPAVGQTKFTEARHARHLAALRTIEALRAHIVTTGKLPGTLAEINDMPIPANPITGKPFPYRLEKDTAVLRADGPEDQPQTEYRLTLK
jgi:hypothetical protein